jgi:predicted GH43/DUF377 family glycosyl hydrolase
LTVSQFDRPPGPALLFSNIVTQQTTRISIRRHDDGAPLIRPTGNGWESGVTFNAAVVRLTQGDAGRGTIRRLLRAAGRAGATPRELVAVLYRGRPRTDPGYLLSRSYIGVALFNSELEPIHRFDEPVLAPDPSEGAPDHLGVEDPRITRIDDTFVMVYCGCGLGHDGNWRATLCTAESTDLLHWQKNGPMHIGARYVDHRGANHVNNKDGVLFPDRLDGWYYLLHRPMIGPISGWSIHLARSRSLTGVWEDLGPILRARPENGWTDTWIGAGAVPLPMGAGRFLEIYHSGHRAADGARLYTLGAAVMNLAGLDPSKPACVIESRLDHFMVPETRWEVEGPYPDSVANVLFTCGAYERDGEIHILYGGGDTYVMAASFKTAELLAAMEPVQPLQPA